MRGCLLDNLGFIKRSKRRLKAVACGSVAPASGTAEAPPPPPEDPPEQTEEDILSGIQVSWQLAVFARCVMQSPALLRVDLRICGLPPELAERVNTAPSCGA